MIELYINEQVGSGNAPKMWIRSHSARTWGSMSKPGLPDGKLSGPAVLRRTADKKVQDGGYKLMMGMPGFLCDPDIELIVTIGVGVMLRSAYQGARFTPFPEIDNRRCLDTLATVAHAIAHQAELTRGSRMRLTYEEWAVDLTRGTTALKTSTPKRHSLPRAVITLNPPVHAAWVF